MKHSNENCNKIEAPEIQLISGASGFCFDTLYPRRDSNPGPID